jgi:hypothetical protein
MSEHSDGLVSEGAPGLIGLDLAPEGADHTVIACSRATLFGMVPPLLDEHVRVGVVRIHAADAMREYIDHTLAEVRQAEEAIDPDDLAADTAPSASIAWRAS